MAAGKYALGLSLLGYVIYRNRDGLADAVSRPINVPALLLTAVCVSISATILIIRWFVLVRAQELPFAFRDAMRLGMVAYFFNAVLPSAIGGDLVKAVGLARRQSRRTVAVATVLFDRLIGLWGLIWIVAVLGAVYAASGNELLVGNAGLLDIVRTAWVILGVTVAAWILLGLLPEKNAERFADRLQRIPKLGGSLAEAWRAACMYRRKPAAVAAALGLAFCSQTFYVLCFHYASRVFADPAAVPTLVEHSLVVPLGMVAQALFPSPGGVGGGEFAFGQLYVLLGRPEQYGVFGSLALRATTWVVGLIGFLIGSQLRPSRPVEDLNGENAATRDSAGSSD